MSDEFVIVHDHVPRNSGDNLPVYTAEDNPDLSLDDRIAATPDLALPILAAGDIRRVDGCVADGDAASLGRDICSSFNDAVTSNQEEVVADFIARGLVSPDTPNIYKETPLLTAVRAGHIGMVRRLVSLGALVNGYGQSATVIYEAGSGQGTHFQRTPLQYAAEYGPLAMVKVLMEECGADDSLVAPDGALALRLAAENGHREIVDYLPARRGGGWRRWKGKHAKQMRIVKRSCQKIGTFCYYTVIAPPKVVFWHAPKWVWENRARIGSWIKKKILGLPGLLVRLAKALAKVPGYIWRAVKATPRLCKWAARAAWRFICGIPRVLEIIAKWLQAGAIRVYQSVAHAAKAIASVIHTALAAVVSWFRQITLQDVWNGIAVAARAVFVQFPKAVLKVALGAGEVLYKSLAILFGCVGLCVYYTGYAIVWLIMYVPVKLFEILAAMGRSIANTVDEIMVHFNPKRV